MDVRPTGHQHMHKGGGYDFSKSLTEGKTFKFGPRDSSTIAVDLSLANLFQKLTVECSGILANPQWKHWRHMEMLKKDQIRLSNGIWRSWHIQFQKGKRPLFCTFVLDPAADSRAHNEPQAIVIEGKYWKRSTDAVANEYRKWRLFYFQKRKQKGQLRGRGGIEGSSQVMQVDNTANTSIFQTSNAFPRPGDERSYMRPLLASAMDVMQPSLEMLNPSLEELLDRLEPMEVMFPSFGMGATPQPRPSNDSYYAQYGAQSPYDTSSTKPVNIPSRDLPGYNGNYNQEYGVSPSAFLNSLGRGDAMDIGTPPNRGMVAKDNDGSSKRPPFEKPYSQQAQTTPTNPMYPQMLGEVNAVPPPSQLHPFLVTLSDDTNMYMSQAPPTIHSDPTPAVPPIDPAHYNYQSQQTPTLFGSEPFPSINPQQKLPGNAAPVIDGCHGNNQPDMVVGEPQMDFMAQMKKMEAEQLQQIQQIDKQQEIATHQYLDLVNQYVTQSGDQPSAHQHQVLMSALSDPTTVEILKYVLLQGDVAAKSTMATPMTHTSETNIKQESPGDEIAATPTPTKKLVTPKHLAKAAGVSDFQSRIVMAAAAQVNIATGGVSASSLSSYSDTPHATPPVTPSIKSPTTDMDISHALMKKFKNARNLSSEEKRIYQELRRQTHISAEQKRRGSIKYGFDQLQSFVINPSQHPSGKVSKAVILEKTLEHIYQQHSERDRREKKMEQMREELRQLNEAIVLCQQKLPASGAPVTRQRFEENRQKFKDYVQSRTQQNYKFWIYSIMLQQLFETYNSSVSTGSVEELCQTVLTWFEQNCSLPSLRPVVLNSLKELSMKTSILSDPSKVPQQLSTYHHDESQ